MEYKNNTIKKEWVCYQCGSLNIELIKEHDDLQVYKCLDCGRVFVKHRGGGQRWQREK